VDGFVSEMNGSGSEGGRLHLGRLTDDTASTTIVSKARETGAPTLAPGAQRLGLLDAGLPDVLENTGTSSVEFISSGTSTSSAAFLERARLEEGGAGWELEGALRGERDEGERDEGERDEGERDEGADDAGPDDEGPDDAGLDDAGLDDAADDDDTTDDDTTDVDDAAGLGISVAVAVWRASLTLRFGRQSGGGVGRFRASVARIASNRVNRRPGCSSQSFSARYSARSRSASSMLNVTADVPSLGWLGIEPPYKQPGIRTSPQVGSG
jgi:hypothetical protein